MEYFENKEGHENLFYKEFLANSKSLGVDSTDMVSIEVILGEISLLIKNLGKIQKMLQSKQDYYNYEIVKKYVFEILNKFFKKVRFYEREIEDKGSCA